MSRIALTVKQVSGFKPLPGEAATLTFPASNSEYYGDVNADRVPHGHGVLLDKDGHSRYGGQWRDGKHHGPGVLVTSKLEYEGEFADGGMHGHGVVKYKESAVGLVARSAAVLAPGSDAGPSPQEYRGTFDREHGRHGRGVMTYRDESVYDGAWVANQRHGHGKYVLSSGDTYEGQWDKDQKHGHGRQRRTTGVVFDGNFVNGKQHGDGKLTFPNGDMYVGSFLDNEISGFGAMRYRNGDTYEGSWRHGVRHGDGKFYLSKRQTTLIGKFSDGLLHGPGTMDFKARGDYFSGIFNRGERKTGTMWFASGAVYAGDWRGENMHGRGLLWYPDGSFYAGAFSASLRNGKGNMTYADGCEYSGEFVQDRRHGQGTLLLPDGRIAVGTWARGSRLVTGVIAEWNGRDTICGVGRVYYDDGSVYEGMIKNGKRDGFGVLAVRMRAGGSRPGEKGTEKAAAAALAAGDIGEMICPHHDETSSSTAVTPSKANERQSPGATTTPPVRTPRTPAAAPAAFDSSSAVVEAASGRETPPLERADTAPPMLVGDGDAVDGEDDELAEALAGGVQGDGDEDDEDDDDEPLSPTSRMVGPLIADNAVADPLPLPRQRRACLFPRLTRVRPVDDGSTAVGGAVLDLDGLGRVDTTPAGFETVLEYKGLWSDDAATGEGTLYFVREDAIYQGQFLFGARCGRGVMVTADGQMYAGDWSDDRPSGNGTFFEIDRAQPIHFLPQVGAFARPRSDSPVLVPHASELDGSTGDLNDSTGSISTAAVGALSWIASRAKGIVSGGSGGGGSSSASSRKRRGSRTALSDALQASTRVVVRDGQLAVLLGYASLYTSHGSWLSGQPSSTSHVFSADGRVAQLEFTAGRPTVDIPHKGRTPAGASSTRGNANEASAITTCIFCRQSFGWRRSANACRLCMRLACSSCLSETPLPPWAPLPEGDSPGNKGSQRQQKSATPQPEQPPPAGKPATPPPGEVGALASDPSAASGDAATSVVPSSPAAVAAKKYPAVRVCVDCQHAVGLGVTFGTVWQPVKLRPSKLSSEAIRAAAANYPSRMRELLRRLPAPTAPTPSTTSADDDAAASSTTHVEGATGESPSAVAARMPPAGHDATADSGNDQQQPMDPAFDDAFVVYRGYVAAGRPHISGSLWFGEVASYTGDFVHGRRHGQGTLVFANGQDYAGGWRDDARHGQGTCRLGDGTFVSGRWVDDQLLTLEYHGYMDSDSGTRCGPGCGYDADAGQRYNGLWLNGQRHGTGTLEFPDGTVYRGQFKNGMPDGRGKQICSTSSYTGSFAAGRPHGTGELRQGSSCLTGEFAFGKPHGVVATRDMVTGDVTRALYARGTPFDQAFVQGRRQADAAARECNACHTAFGLFFRRHHCRCCGLVFCDGCTPRRTKLPSHFQDWSKRQSGDGSFPPVDCHNAVYRTCVACCDELSHGRAIGSRYFTSGKRDHRGGLEYHGGLDPGTLLPSGRGFYAMGTTSFYAPDAGAALPRMREWAERRHARGGSADDNDEIEREALSDANRHGVEGVKRWWQEVVTSADLHEVDEQGNDVTTPPSSPTSSSQPRRGVRLTMMLGCTVDDFPHEPQDLGFEVAVFVDPSKGKKATAASDVSHPTTQGAAGDSGASSFVAQFGSLSEADRVFRPAVMPTPPEVPKPAACTRPAPPVSPSHAQIANCIAAARQVSADRLGVPSLLTLRATHICAGAPRMPPRGEPYETAWGTWNTVPMIATRTTARGDKADANVLNGLAQAGVVVPPSVPSVFESTLPELEIGLAVAVVHDAATGDMVARSSRIYPRGSATTQQATEEGNAAATTAAASPLPDEQPPQPKHVDPVASTTPVAADEEGEEEGDNAAVAATTASLDAAAGNDTSASSCPPAAPSSSSTTADHDHSDHHDDRRSSSGDTGTAAADSSGIAMHADSLAAGAADDEEHGAVVGVEGEPRTAGPF